MREKDVAKVIEQNETLVDRLKVLKEKSGMTSAQIAEKARVPESTVTRIFSGKTPNPTIITVIAMTKAMGGTAADIFDDDTQVNVSTPTSQVVISDLERKNNEIVELYKEIIKSKNLAIKMLAIVLLSVFGVVLLLLLFDLFNGGIGYFRH